ncbi:MAG: tyrosine-type recombinase/integrase [Propylenella sp.]
MTRYNPKNERIKRAYLRHLKEARGKADSTVDAVRRAIGRFETYTGRKDLATFNREQAIGFKKHLANGRAMRSGQAIAKSTLVAVTSALKDFFGWLSSQAGYKSRIRVTDIEYLNLSEKETRAAKEPRFKTFPTMEQIGAVIRQMPSETEVEQRDRALVAMTILTGARDSALASLRLKHIDLERKLVVQDPRDVRTKRSKRIDTFFFPVGDDFEAIVVEWVRYLREVKLFGNEDPVFPHTRVRRASAGSFIADGVEPSFWQNTQPIRRIFHDAFAKAGLPYFRPHSFRDTLVKHGEDHAPTIAHFKAWSQNLGHEYVGTTLTSYGSITPHRQGELVRSVTVGESSDDTRTRELFDQFMRMVKQGTKPVEG